MPRISVIIPVYNLKNYIARCLDSVCRQTFKDLEIICINDCSTDNSLEILNKYACSDSRIKVINFSVNKGVSTARNTGIKIAQGEYIGFVDGDDFIDLDFYEKLYNRALVTDSDIIKGADVIMVSPQGKLFQTIQNKNIKICKQAFNYQFWTAIFKTSFIKKNNLFFPEDNTCFEDPYWVTLAAYYTNNIEIVDDAIYHYERRPESQSNKLWTKQQLESYIKYIKILIDFGEKKLKSSTIDYKMFFIFISQNLFNIKKYRCAKDSMYSDILKALYIKSILLKSKYKTERTKDENILNKK